MGLNGNTAECKFPAIQEQDFSEKTARVTVTFGLTPREKRILEIVAVSVGMSVAALIRRIVFEGTFVKFMVERSIQSNPLLVITLDALDAAAAQDANGANLQSVEPVSASGGSK